MWALGLPTSPTRKNSEILRGVTGPPSTDMSGSTAPSSIETTLDLTDTKPKESRTDTKPKESRTDTKPKESRTDTKPKESRTDTKPKEPRTDTKPKESRTDTKPKEPRTDTKPKESRTDTKPKESRTGPRGGRIGPRRGAMTRSAWRCCVCGHKNKTGENSQTGRSSVCSNLDKNKCAARLSVDETEARPDAMKSLNHQRCNNCFPAGRGVYAAGHDKLWPLCLDAQAKGELESNKAKDMAEDATSEFDFMVAEKRPKAAKRDPLTWQRIGEWPRQAEMR
ncbi:trans-Golgi network integral membrane protein 2 [Venturia nashicola]|uniref:Trans-Golgi network integral membrane protein 2 n=1 Tax=Venturia nashicola TaxID=86259 RepID=A0A4Z1PUL0_9PEZI|nr:trans-Golgi network integral membrane protein 2 [Venturia nashicola]TLD38885.1 trans-Golgi network integral membrane protein 2 [Venturia nashicola]